MTMNKQKAGIMLMTLAIVGVGGVLLFSSTNDVMDAVQENLSTQKEIVTNQQEELEDMLVADQEENMNSQTGEMYTGQELPPSYNENDQVIARYEQAVQELREAEEQQIARYEQEIQELRAEQIISTCFVKDGEFVRIKDSLVEMETAQENGRIIMDFIFDYVDKTILTPYGIDKTAYSYDIQRQYQEVDEVEYGVFLKQEDKIIGSIGIRLNDEPELISFTRSGLVDLYGGEKNDIPEEYKIDNWCDTKEQKEEIYKEYLDDSKEIVEHVLGLPPLKEEMGDVTDTRYFSADDGWSSVTFGYELEDGTYIRVFYNRVNQMWDGFVIE